MLRTLNSAFSSGISKIKWFFSILSERIKVEIAVMKILGQSEKFEKKRKDLLVSMGERLVELKDMNKTNIFEDQDIKDAFKELDTLDDEISELRKTAEEISSLEV
ncbi:MAG: hypothetical protein JSV21_03910 [Nitrospirota bacterium]|nr:MAG: hypothetical protein JSV21_03910 [Nitrospirota bacterium]